MSDQDQKTHALTQHIRQLNEVGVALSREREIPALIEQVLRAAMALTGADGGTLYTVTDDSHLAFEIVLNESLGLHWGGTTRTSVPLPDIALFTPRGNPDRATVAAACFHRGETINVDDVYSTESFDFSGTRDFDSRNDYLSRSILTVPLKDHQGVTFSILQLINPAGEDNSGVFDDYSQFLVQSLASQASLALANARLIADHRRLFESFIELIANAIDDKSPHTGHHCRRVPELTMMLTKAAARQTDGIFSEFDLSAEEEYELRVASWLHDCGKIATPEWIVDKATKLETRFDRLELVEARFEILRRDAEIELLRSRIQRLMDDSRPTTDSEATYARRITELREQLRIVRRSNIGSEQMPAEDQTAIREMAATGWIDFDGERRNLLSDDEKHNLLIHKGTLTAQERALCNEHINVTIRMLESLEYPSDLSRVPEIAGSHHERMDGTGFPRGLTGDQMSIQARAMAIADVFESLTAEDRPYKKAMSLSEALSILGDMKNAGHIDPDLFDLFLTDGIYRRYADEFMDPSRIDVVNLDGVPGAFATQPAGSIKPVDPGPR